MTTTQHIAEHDPPEQGSPQSWGGIAVSFAGQIAKLAEHRRGDLAALRRMDLDEPDSGVFWRLLAQHDLAGSPALESKWGLILHGIALMTPTNSAGGRTAHDGQMAVGRALFLGGEPHREKGYYSELRLNRLLTAREEIQRTLLARMFRMLASAGVSFNWGEMARFILDDDDDDEKAEASRRRIARDYYRAEWRSAQPSDDEKD